MRVITLLIALATLLAPVAAAADQRVALVIGNDRYQNVPMLQKAGNDARAIGARLSALGFDVVTATDAPRREMNRALQDFANRVRPGDVAMFYYAGHAIEIDGENYLLPVDIPDAEPGQEGFVRSEAIGLDRILRQVRGTGARLTIAVLDACRDNPFAADTGRSVGATRGLGRIAAPGGTFVMYSADAGESALDRLSDADPNPNSVFTRTLLPMLGRPGLDLVGLARETRRSVHQLAGTVGHQQTPAYYDALLGSFAFVPEGTPAPPPPAPPPSASTPGPAAGSAVEVAFWTSAESSGSAAAYRSYLSRFPQGLFAELARVKLDELATAAARQPPPQPPQQQPAQQPPPRGDGVADDWLATRIARYQNDPRGPSYNCARASTRDEVMICGSPMLAGLDRELAELYTRLRASLTGEDKQALQSTQTRWLRERRTCRSEACVRDLYAERIRFLEAF